MILFVELLTSSRIQWTSRTSETRRRKSFTQPPTIMKKQPPSQPDLRYRLCTYPSTMDNQQFRTVKTRSSTRARLFALESFASTAGYVYYLLKAVETPATSVQTQNYLLSIFGVVYFARLNLMAQWILPREISMDELVFVNLVFVPAILFSFALLRGEISAGALLTSALLYTVGSFVNTYSELQRKYWKQRPENKGRCFMGGLFRFSRNVNYLGDVILFTGWAMLTGNWRNAWVPVFMFLSFYFHHIPGKEAYLAQRYRDEWPQYAAKTKSFVPYVC